MKLNEILEQAEKDIIRAGKVPAEESKRLEKIFDCFRSPKSINTVLNYVKNTKENELCCTTYLNAVKFFWHANTKVSITFVFEKYGMLTIVEDENTPEDTKQFSNYPEDFNETDADTYVEWCRTARHCLEEFPAFARAHSPAAS